MVMPEANDHSRKPPEHSMYDRVLVVVPLVPWDHHHPTVPVVPRDHHHHRDGLTSHPSLPAEPGATDQRPAKVPNRQAPLPRGPVIRVQEPATRQTGNKRMTARRVPPGDQRESCPPPLAPEPEGDRPMPEQSMLEALLGEKPLTFHVEVYPQEAPLSFSLPCCGDFYCRGLSTAKMAEFPTDIDTHTVQCNSISKHQYGSMPSVHLPISPAGRGGD